MLGALAVPKVICQGKDQRDGDFVETARVRGVGRAQVTCQGEDQRGGELTARVRGVGRTQVVTCQGKDQRGGAHGGPCNEDKVVSVGESSERFAALLERVRKRQRMSSVTSESPATGSNAGGPRDH